MSARLVVPILILSLALAACGGGSEDTVRPAAQSTTTAAATPTTDNPATTVSATTTSSIPPAPEWRVVIVSDSLSMATWPDYWGELIEQDLTVPVEVKNHAYGGSVDYFEIIEDPEVKADLAAADVIFIPPEADYLRTACPVAAIEAGNTECRDQAVEDYRVEWGTLLDNIRVINPDAQLRSAKAWVWMAPPQGRDGLVAFMDAAAEVTEAHGGLVLDLNATLTGSDYSDSPPVGWVDLTGHFTGTGSKAVAAALHDLGYEA